MLRRKMNQKLKYHIKRYRSINDVKLEIEFGKMNFLMGGNESGKSNLLKAIHLMGKNSKEKYIENIDKLKLAA
jgi:AAA15 family ATPase/GTPase